MERDGTMRTVFVVTMLAGAAWAQERPAATRLGEPVEDFAVTPSTGEAFRLQSLRRTAEEPGKIVVLTFWCTTCGSCRRIEREFEIEAKEYAGKGVEYFMVDSNGADGAEVVNRFLAEQDLDVRVLLDGSGEIARWFGARLTTTTAVIDPEGRLRYYGGFGGAEDAVKNLLEGQDVALPEKRGFG